MESKTVSFIVVWVMIFALLSGECRASFWTYKKCFRKCMPICWANNWDPICLPFCLAKCAAKPPIHRPDSTYFCALGCATSRCSKISTKYNPRLDEVESCVDRCSGSCKKSYVSTVY
ncbi:hypothetical protein M5689_021606 [Euphorbia peplus]|nr:hypothetical protein M5689_021606 [Euphorbia peplus]